MPDILDDKMEEAVAKALAAQTRASLLSVVEVALEEVKTRLNREHSEGIISYRELKAGVNNAAFVRDAALAAQPRDDVRWMPRIGEKVRATKHCPDAELWNRCDMFVIGVRLANTAHYYGPDYDVTVSTTWPEVTDPTDGFRIGHTAKPDELEPCIDTALAPTTQPEGDDGIPPVAKGYKRQWYRCERHEVSGYKDYVPYSLSNPICIMPCGCDLKERHVVAAEQPDTQGTDNGLAGEIADAWDDLVNVDDRTSPEEYPDMCLITRDELAEFMSRADPKISYWRALAKAALATRTDRKAVLEELRAIVAEYDTGEVTLGHCWQKVRALAEGAGK